VLSFLLLLFLLRILYITIRLCPWLRIKHKVRRRKGVTSPLSRLYGHFGLVRLTALGRDVSWAKA